MSNPNQKTVDEVELVTKQLRYEGKVDKDTYDWFKHDFKKKQETLGNKRRHKEQENPVLDIR